jgi:hypothetical protein
MGFLYENQYVSGNSCLGVDMWENNKFSSKSMNSVEKKHKKLSIIIDKITNKLFELQINYSF